MKEILTKIYNEPQGSRIKKIIPEENTLFIEEVFVKRNHRGKGLGKRLVAFAEEIGCRKRLSNIANQTNKRLILITS